MVLSWHHHGYDWDVTAFNLGLNFSLGAKLKISLPYNVICMILYNFENRFPLGASFPQF